jgi:CreA protein
MSSFSKYVRPSADHIQELEQDIDPKMQGVACHISRAVTGGVKGALGLAEDTSDASIACRQVGPIKIPSDLQDGAPVFAATDPRKA